MTPPPARRRARARLRRRHRRWIGRGLLAASALPVLVALALGVSVLDDRLRSSPPTTAFVAPATTSITPPVGGVPLGPGTSLGAGGGEATGSALAPVAPPTTGSANANAGLSEVVLDTAVGRVVVHVPPPRRRPAVNHRPQVTGPTFVPAGGEGRTAVPGVSVDDPDSSIGEYGMLLVLTGGTIRVDDTSGVQLFTRNGVTRLAMLGTLDELNEALRGLEVDLRGRSRSLEIGITDFGHGDQSVALDARLTITVDTP